MKTPTKVKDAALAYRTSKKIHTYQDYLDLPEDEKRYEIINGELIMSPSPLAIHQVVKRKIEFELLKFLENNPRGEVFDAPFDVILSETNVVQPDLLFIAKENLEILTEKNITGAPDLIIEILSPNTAYYDLLEKKELYAGFGVKEYWIVDPKKQWVEVHQNRDGKYQSIQKVERAGIVASIVIAGWQIDLKKIFKD